MQKFRNRLLFYFLPLAMVPLLLASLASVMLMLSMAREQFQDRLNTSFRGVALELDHLKSDLLSRAEALARDPELVEAIAGGDRQTVLGILERAVGTLHVQEAAATDVEGTVLAEGHHPTHVDAQVVDLESIAVELDLPSVKLARHDLGVGVLATHPVERAGELVGTLILARLLDYRFLTNVRSKYGVEAAVYDGDRLQAVTLRDPAMITDKDLDAARRGMGRDARDAMQDVELGETQYFVTGQQIRSDNGDPIGTLVFACSTRNMYDLLGTLATIFGVIAAVLLVIAVAITFRVTRTVVKPIDQLIRMTQRVAGGDLSARVPPTSLDEVGQLAVALNQMAEDLQHTTTSIERLNEEIAERKRVEQERQHLIEKLGAQNAELERFTYTVSHDLKSPLFTIGGFLNVIDEDLADGNTEEAKANLARIAGAAEKMAILLDELLELSRIGRLVNPPEPVALGELVHEAMQLVWGEIELRGVRVDVASDLPILFGDRARLLEVVQNLISNAVKYTGDQRAPRVEIGVREDDGETVCYVRDNGIGIAPVFHEKVFGLFEQLDPETEGTGIGLALAKRIVEVHGGRIWVESDGTGNGSTFCFTLPPAPQDTEDRAATSPVTSEGGLC